MERVVLNALVPRLRDGRSRCSAYDCEFVALAEEQRLPLVTMDRQILHDFSDIAVSLQEFTRE